MKFFGPLFILCIILSCNKNVDNYAEHHSDACNTDEPKTNIEIKNISAYDFCNVVFNPEKDITVAIFVNSGSGGSLNKFRNVSPGDL